MIIRFHKLFFCFFVLTAFTSVVKAQRTDDPPTVKEGMQISRSYLIKQIQSSDSSMVFKQNIDVNSQPHFIGVDKDGTSVQLFGKEDELRRAVFTFKFTLNHDVNLLQYKRMAYFTFLLAGKQAISWLEECSAEFAKNPKKSFYKTKSFDFNRNGFYRYELADKGIVVTFTD